MISEEKISKIGGVLNDPRRPLKERFRALFTLKNIGGSVAIKCIADCFSDNSALLKHELAYCLGQMKDPAAIPILTSILSDVKQEPMVRHEAGKSADLLSVQMAVQVHFVNNLFLTIAAKYPRITPLSYLHSLII